MSRFERDPVSVHFDTAARRLLSRAYEKPGEWVGTKVSPPGADDVAVFAARGINVWGHESRPTGKSINRWVRGFVRAVYYQHKWYYQPGQGLANTKRTSQAQSRGVRYQVGVYLAGWPVEIMIVPSGNAYSKIPKSERYTSNPAARADSRTWDWIDQ